MNWKVKYLPEALQDLAALYGSQRRLVQKAIRKVSSNPLPVDQGGYGKPLGNHVGSKLNGLLKVKLKSSGLRIIYRLVCTETEMIIIVIGARADNEVYETAHKRFEKERRSKD